MSVWGLATVMLSAGKAVLFLLIAAAALGIAVSVIAGAVRSAKWNRWVELVQQTPQRYSCGTLQSMQDYDKDVVKLGGISQKDAEQIAATLYADLIQSRQLKNLGNVRVGLTEACFSEWNALIQADLDAHRIHMERPVIQPIVRVAGWIPYEGNVRIDPFQRFDPLPTVHDRAIVLQIMVRAREYDIDDQSSRIIGGSAQKEHFLMYECVLIHRDRNRKLSDSVMPPAGERYEWDADVFRRMTPQISDHRFVR